MCFYKQSLQTKSVLSKFYQPEKHSPSEVSVPDKKGEEESIIEDVLVKKQKTLDQNAPGLFEFLTKLSQNDISSDLPSQIDGSEEKTQSIVNSESISSDLSNVITFKPELNNPYRFPLPSFNCFQIQNETPTNNNIEEAFEEKTISFLNHKAPGLFEHLIKLSQYEGTNELSDFSNSARKFHSYEDTADLSNVIRFKLQSLKSDVLDTAISQQGSIKKKKLRKQAEGKSKKKYAKKKED